MAKRREFVFEEGHVPVAIGLPFLGFAVFVDFFELIIHKRWTKRCVLRFVADCQHKNTAYRTCLLSAIYLELTKKIYPFHLAN